MNIVSMSIAASLFILAVVVIRALFMHILPKNTFILLWGIVIFRLMIPVSIPSRLSVWNMIEDFVPTPSKAAFINMPSAILSQRGILGDSILSIREDMAILAVPEYAEAVAPIAKTMGDENLAEKTINAGIADIASGDIGAKPPLGPSLFFSLYLAGVCFCLAGFLVPHLRFRRMYRTALPVNSSFVKQWVASHPLRRKMCIKQSGSVDSPLTYGLWKPIILLPKTVALDNDEFYEPRLSYILTHEYVHIRHFDIVWKWVLAFTLAVHWFNPLVWLMYVLANRDIELFCDETVVRSYGEKAKSVYALILLGLEEKRNAFLSLCSNFSKNAVEERIVSIMKTRRLSFFSIVAALVMIGGMTLVFATSRAAGDAVLAESQDSLEPAVLPDSTLSGAGILSDESSPSGYVERMLFATKGESALKVTYDGSTWENTPVIKENENWYWYSYEEYAEHIESIISKRNIQDSTHDCMGLYSSQVNESMLGAEKDHEKLMQTLVDIKNGIRVSRPKTIFITEETGPASGILGRSPINSQFEGWLQWYCYGYTFRDKAGNTVDLGLFETRDELFAAMKQYYDKEVAANRLTQLEADNLYKAVTHPVRNIDEEPLVQKLANLKNA